MCDVNRLFGGYIYREVSGRYAGRQHTLNAYSTGQANKRCTRQTTHSSPAVLAIAMLCANKSPDAQPVGAQTILAEFFLIGGHP
jgi:hypothetical protein